MLRRGLFRLRWLIGMSASVVLAALAPPARSSAMTPSPATTNAALADGSEHLGCVQPRVQFALPCFGHVQRA